jgi:hypothetical protein
MHPPELPESVKTANIAKDSGPSKWDAKSRHRGSVESSSTKGLKARALAHATEATRALASWRLNVHRMACITGTLDPSFSGRASYAVTSCNTKTIHFGSKKHSAHAGCRVDERSETLSFGSILIAPSIMPCFGFLCHGAHPSIVLDQPLGLLNQSAAFASKRTLSTPNISASLSLTCCPCYMWLSKNQPHSPM